jgi:hypothetical protein
MIIHLHLPFFERFSVSPRLFFFQPINIFHSTKNSDHDDAHDIGRDCCKRKERVRKRIEVQSNRLLHLSGSCSFQMRQAHGQPPNLNQMTSGETRSMRCDTNIIQLALDANVGIAYSDICGIVTMFRMLVQHTG